MGNPALSAQVGTEAPSAAPRTTIDPIVFGVSSVTVAGVLAFSLLARESARALFLGAQDFIVSYLGWVLSLGVGVFLVVSIGLGLGPMGRIRLSPRDDDAPEFPRATWLAMLFSAGMGIGLLFYGVAEPILHFADPPGTAGVGSAGDVAHEAMRISLYHWGFHAWGIYALCGLALAYFHHRKGLPLSMRSTLAPVLGRWTHRWPGKLVDVIAVFGTLFGLATSLGLGAMQINAGLARLLGWSQSVGVQIALIAAITFGATLSLVSGLGRGIRRLSEINVGLAALLCAFVFVAGPTLALLAELPGLLSSYVAELPALTLGLSAKGNVAWQKDWTLFYWAWWISWAPFVGIFVARISRGRTVREFVFGVLVAPTLATFVWFSVLGGTALESELSGAGGIARAVSTDVSTAIYSLLDQLPASGLSSALAAVVVALFFITSSDSGSYVVDTLTSGGHPDPPMWQRVFWATAEGVVAVVLLVVGGLKALQSAAINTGLPFCIVLLVATFCLIRALRSETTRRDAPPG